MQARHAAAAVVVSATVAGAAVGVAVADFVASLAPRVRASPVVVAFDSCSCSLQVESAGAEMTVVALAGELVKLM